MRSATPISGVIAVWVLLTACAPAATDGTPLAADPATTAPVAPTVTTPSQTTPTTLSSDPLSSDPASMTTLAVTIPPPPIFEATVALVTDDLVGASWREGCPLDTDQLVVLTLEYWNFDGEVAHGRMVVNAMVADDVVAAFGRLFEMHFPIERIVLADEYGGDDNALMAANATSAFNCRLVDDTDHWSNHAFGLAIDINPLLNPWVRSNDVLPIEGTEFVDRALHLPGMISPGNAVVGIFEELGWSWGGDWRSPDYMHFSKGGS